MNLDKAIKILETWVEADREFRENKLESDYDKFCEERNIAIETLIDELYKEYWKGYNRGYEDGWEIARSGCSCRYTDDFKWLQICSDEYCKIYI